MKIVKIFGDNCPSCIAYAPVFKSFVEKTGMESIEVNAHSNKDESLDMYTIGIRGIPATRLYTNENVLVGEILGPLDSVELIQEFVDKSMQDKK